MTSHSSNWGVLGSVVAACSLALCSRAAAQSCTPEWATQFASGDLSSYPNAFAVYDADGAGPQPAELYAGGAFNSAGGLYVSHVARWNGQTWSPLGTGTNGYVHALAVFDADGDGANPPHVYAGGDFAIAGGVGALRVARWIGSAWAPLGVGLNGPVYTLAVHDDDGDGPNPAALYVGGDFTSAGGVPAGRVARWNGAAWQAVGAGFNGVVRALATVDLDGSGPAPPLLCAGGSFTASGATSVQRIAVFDGAAWAPLGAGVDGELEPDVRALLVFDDDADGPDPPALYVGGTFDTAGGIPATNIARWDPAASPPWAAVGSGLGDGYYSEVRTLAAYDADGPGPDLPVLYAGGNFDVAGTEPVSRIARWDGSAWFPLGNGLEDDLSTDVTALAVYGAGPELPRLVVGGHFLTVEDDALAASRIAEWDGSIWRPFGNEMNGAVRALVVFDEDQDGPAAEALYVGGTFTYTGGIFANRVARWDGATWSTLGDGLDGSVHALAIFDDDGPGPDPPALYVGGEFANAGGQPASSIARWDGQLWSPLGEGVSGDVFGPEVDALVVFDDDGLGPELPALYVGGRFQMAGQVAATAIAKWDGESWSPLGVLVPPAGTTPAVYGLAVFDEDNGGPQPPALFAGGVFVSAGGVPVDYIARCDGAAWSPVGTGIRGPIGLAPTVTTLATLDIDGDGPGGKALYVGGSFQTAGGVPAKCIARWDGSSWSALGPGLNDEVDAMSVFDPDGAGPAAAILVAGGDFYTADSWSEKDHFAKWDGISWQSMPGGANSVVWALAAFDGDGAGPTLPALYAGGSFQQAGYVSAGRFTSWGCPATPNTVAIVSASPPLDNPYVPGEQPFRDVLQTGFTPLLTQGIGWIGTPSEGGIIYNKINVTFAGLPNPTPSAASISVTCTGGNICPNITNVTGAGLGPYEISFNVPIPPAHCTTLTFAGNAAGQAVKYQYLPGDVNMSGAVSAVDVQSLVSAIATGQVALPANLPRYDINRSGAVSTADLLRLIGLLNGINTPQAWTGVTVVACP